MSVLLEDRASMSGESPTVSPTPHLGSQFDRRRVEQLSWWALAGALLVWALVDPRFRGQGGFPAASICLPLSAAAGSMVLGKGVTASWRRFAWWFALALVAQAAALQLIDAGPLLRYQHYKPLGRLFAEAHPIVLLAVAVQTVLVLVGLKRRLSEIGPWVGRTLGRWTMLALALGFVLSSAAVQRDFLSYLGDLYVASFIQSVALGNIVLMALALPERVATRWLGVFQRLFGEHSEEQAAGRVRGWWLIGAAAVWVAVLAAALNLVAYERHPHITDEVAYLYQARYLAEGRIVLPAPPVAEGFELYLMEVAGDRWYAAPPPGWPALLAVGVRLGAPWVVNPLLGGLNVLLIYLLLRDLYGHGAARLAVFLVALSPWYVFMAMNFMTHTFTLTCALVAAVAVVRARRSHGAAWAGVAGVSVGIATLIRPLDGLIVAVLIGLWVLGIGGRRLSLAAIAAFAFSAAAVGAMVLPYNQELTGSATSFPLNSYVDSHFGAGRNDFGFGADKGFGWPIQPFPGHSPLGALINANLNIASMNTELLGWSTGSLLLALLALFSRSRRRSDYLMLATCVAVFIPYFFYYFSGGPDFGARYWYLMFVPLLALTVRGIYVLQSRVSTTGSSPANRARVVVAVSTLALLALVNYFPWRALDKYHDFWGMSPDVTQLAAAYGFGRSLVLIRGPESHPDFASAAIYNPLDWQADAPVYAWDRSPVVRARLLNVFADRPVWIVEAPSITGRGYEVVRGPVLAATLMQEAAAASPGA